MAVAKNKLTTEPQYKKNAQYIRSTDAQYTKCISDVDHSTGIPRQRVSQFVLITPFFFVLGNLYHRLCFPNPPHVYAALSSPINAHVRLRGLICVIFTDTSVPRSTELDCPPRQEGKQWRSPYSVPSDCVYNFRIGKRGLSPMQCTSICTSISELQQNRPWWENWTKSCTSTASQGLVDDQSNVHVHLFGDM